MNQERLDQLTSGFLISAGQIAYVESAFETAAILESFTDFFRYAIRGGRQETLSNELDIFKKYILFQQVRYNNLIEVELDENISYQSIFIRSMSVIDYFDSLIDKLTDDTIPPIKAVLSVRCLEDNLTLCIEFLSNRHKTSTYTKCLDMS